MRLSLMENPSILSVKQYNEIYTQSKKNRDEALLKKQEARSKIEQLKLDAEIRKCIELYPVSN